MVFDSSSEVDETFRLFKVDCTYAGQMLRPTWICAACAEKHDAPESGRTFEGEAGLEAYWVKIDWKPVCQFCFTEKFARAN
jgi:hypothetical protein